MWCCFCERRDPSWCRLSEKRGEQRGIQQGLTQGIQRETDLVLRLARRRLGALPQQIEVQIRSLSVEKLEELGEALLDLGSLDDLTDWLHALD